MKIAQSLGPCYVPYIVKEMKESLTKGYQVSLTISSASRTLLVCMLCCVLLQSMLKARLQNLTNRVCLCFVYAYISLIVRT